jgi:hypothetical protein
MPSLRHPFDSIGRLRVNLGRSKPLSQRPRNPSSHSLFLSFLFLTLRRNQRDETPTATRWASPRCWRPREDSATASSFLFSSLDLLCSAWDLVKRRQPASNAAVSPFSGVCAHRWVDAPPLNNFTVGLYPHAPSRIEDRRWFFYPQYRLSEMRRPWRWRPSQLCVWRRLGESLSPSLSTLWRLVVQDLHMRWLRLRPTVAQREHERTTASTRTTTVAFTEGRIKVCPSKR